jgi:hypothetical protein
MELAQLASVDAANAHVRWMSALLTDGQQSARGVWHVAHHLSNTKIRFVSTKVRPEALAIGHHAFINAGVCTQL